MNAAEKNLPRICADEREYGTFTTEGTEERRVRYKELKANGQGLKANS